MQYMPGTLVMSDLLDLHWTLHNLKLYNYIGFELDYTNHKLNTFICKKCRVEIDKYNSKQI